MPKQTNKDKALIALLTTSSIVEASNKCGLSQETLYRFLKDKDFLAEYRNARRATVENAVTTIQNATSETVETLKRNLHCENPQAEIRAAEIILNNSLKSLELFDVIERLEKLENEYQEQTKENRERDKRRIL